MFWFAKAKNDCYCDFCKSLIRKGMNRVVYGYKSLAYTMVDRNICLNCFQEQQEVVLLKRLGIKDTELENLKRLKAMYRKTEEKLIIGKARKN